MKRITVLSHLQFVLMSERQLPDALLLITAGCAHCPVVLDALTRLIKEAALGRLHIINVAAHPDYAEQRGVRSVPWTQLGEFELEGALSIEQLRAWAQLAHSDEGMVVYLEHLLSSGQLQRCVRLINQQPARFDRLLDLLTKADVTLDVRIGVSAALEQLGHEGFTAEAVTGLGALTAHANARVRADACHALSFSTLTAAKPYLEICLHDQAAEVHEIAAESLAVLAQTQST